MVKLSVMFFQNPLFKYATVDVTKLSIETIWVTFRGGRGGGHSAITQKSFWKVSINQIDPSSIQ